MGAQPVATLLTTLSVLGRQLELSVHSQLHTLHLGVLINCFLPILNLSLSPSLYRPHTLLPRTPSSRPYSNVGELSALQLLNLPPRALARFPVAELKQPALRDARQLPMLRISGAGTLGQKVSVSASVVRYSLCRAKRRLQGRWAA